MKFELPDMTPEGRRYMEELEKLVNLEVAVGFQAGDAYEDGATIAEVAAYNEFGTSTIPSRPFMAQTLTNHEDELREGCAQVNEAIMSGMSAEQALEQLGVLGKGLMQQEIVEGNFEPNAESTIKKKGSSQPLIDTGTMRQSVNYVVRSRSE